MSETSPSPNQPVSVSERAKGGGGGSACMHAYVPHGMREKSKPHPPKICHSHPGVHAVSKDMMLGEGERECNDG